MAKTKSGMTPAQTTKLWRLIDLLSVRGSVKIDRYSDDSVQVSLIDADGRGVYDEYGNINSVSVWTDGAYVGDGVMAASGAIAIAAVQTIWSGKQFCHPDPIRAAAGELI